MASGELELWYRQPAAHWKEALPVGNGRLGAMAFGRPIGRYPGVERLQLNEETVWYGGHRDRHNPNALAALPEIRRLLMAGRGGGSIGRLGRSLAYLDGIPLSL